MVTRPQVAFKAEAEGEGGGGETKAKPRQVITEQKLKALIRSKLKCDEDIGELAGGIGEEIKKAAEKNFLNRKVFGWIVQLSRMSEEKMADCIEDLEHYLDISGLNERASKVQRLALPEPEETEGDGKVKPFPRPAGAQKD